MVEKAQNNWTQFHSTPLHCFFQKVDKKFDHIVDIFLNRVYINNVFVRIWINFVMFVMYWRDKSVFMLLKVTFHPDNPRQSRRIMTQNFPESVSRETLLESLASQIFVF